MTLTRIVVSLKMQVGLLKREKKILKKTTCQKRGKELNLVLRVRISF